MGVTRYVLLISLISKQAAIHRVLPQDIAPNQFAGYQEAPDDLNVGRFVELNDLDVVPNPDEPMVVPSSPNRSAFRNIYGPGKCSRPIVIFCNIQL